MILYCSLQDSHRRLAATFSIDIANRTEAQVLLHGQTVHGRFICTFGHFFVKDRIPCMHLYMQADIVIFLTKSSSYMSC